SYPPRLQRVSLSTNICEHTKHQARNAKNWKRLLRRSSTKNTSRSRIDNNSTSTNNSTSNATVMIRANEPVKRTNKKVRQQRYNNSKVSSRDPQQTDLKLFYGKIMWILTRSTASQYGVDEFSI
ncbi:unnamed protein product, partial [Linum tenue]